jgi:hypothetical protein
MNTQKVTWVLGCDDDAGLEELRDTVRMLYQISPDLQDNLAKPPSKLYVVEWGGETWLEGTQSAVCALGRVTVTIRMAESGRFAWRLAVEVSLSMQ